MLKLRRQYQNHGFSTVLAVVVLGATILTGTIGYFEYSGSGDTDNIPSADTANNFYDEDKSLTTSDQPPSSSTTEHQSAGTKTVSTSSANERRQTPESWHTYRNENYGFSFRYPEAYSEFNEKDPLKRTDRNEPPPYACDNEVSSEGYDCNQSIKEITSLNNEGAQSTNRPTISVRVFNLGDYFYRAAPDGVLYEYDHNKKVWRESSPPGENIEVVNPDAVSVNDKTGYQISSGDAGHTYDGIAIPYPEEQVMVEVGFNTDQSTTQEIDREQLLSSFTFFESSRKNGKRQTYKNDNWGISFQHPNVFEVSSQSSSSVYLQDSDFSPSVHKQATIGFLKKTDLPLSDYWRDKMTVLEVDSVSQIKQKVQHLDEIGPWGLEIFISSQNLRISIDNYYLEEHRQSLIETLSTVTFLGNEDGSNNQRGQDKEKEMTLQTIKGQYTDELLSSPVFGKEFFVGKSMVHKYTLKKREPTALVRWDHNDDGSKSVAVYNKMIIEDDSVGHEVILFAINKNNNISNPRLLYRNVESGGVIRGLDLQTESVDGKSGLHISFKYTNYEGTNSSNIYFVHHGGKIIPWHPNLSKLDMNFTNNFDRASNLESGLFVEATKGAHLRFKYDGDETIGPYDSLYQTCALQGGACTKNLIDTFMQNQTQTFRFTMIPQTVRRGDFDSDGDNDGVVVVQKKRAAGRFAGSSRVPTDYYLAAFENKDAKLAFGDQVFLGSVGISLDRLSVDNEITTVDIKRFSNDDRGDPLLTLRRHFQFDGSKLQQTYSDITDSSDWQTHTITGSSKTASITFRAPPEFIVTKNLSCGSYKVEAPCIYASTEDAYQSSEYKNKFELDIESVNAAGYTYECNKGVCSDKPGSPTVYGGYTVASGDDKPLLFLNPTLYPIESDVLKAQLMEEVVSSVEFSR